MSSRVIALFLAFVLLWSAFSTIEAPQASAQDATGQQHRISPLGTEAPTQQGSVAHHHLDDLPSQAQADPPTDKPLLLPLPLRFATIPVATAAPQAAVPVAARAPLLAGPLRPPRHAILKV
jgi:hypothetical protein